MYLSDDNQELFKQICDDICDPSKKCIAFVGSGLSSAPPANIPTWIATFYKLCKSCENIGLGGLTKKLKKIAETAEYDPQFLTVCFEQLRNEMGKPAYENAMQTILKPKNSGIPPTINRLVSIQFDGIITTNLDTLIEDGSEEAYKYGKRPAIRGIYTSSDGIVQGKLPRNYNWIWKIHGTIERPETWIFTSSEYSKSIYSNSEYREALKTVTQSARLVFLGFGGSDPDIDLILSLLSDTFGGREDSHILLTRDSEKLDLHKLANFNINVIEYGGPEDHSALISFLDTFPFYS